MALDACSSATRCREAAERCVDASRRYGLASLPVALLWLAGSACARRVARRRWRPCWPRPPPRLPATRGWRPTPGAACARRITRCGRTGTRCARPSSGRWSSPAWRRRWSRCTRGRYWWAVLRALSDDDLGLPARAEIAGSRRSGAGSVSRCSPWSTPWYSVGSGRGGRGERAARGGGPARRSVGATGRGTALRLAAEAAVRTAGANRPAGCGRRRRSSPSAATTGSPESAGRCWSRPAPRRSAAGAAGRPSRRPCAGSASPAGSSTCSNSSREDLPTREIAARLFLSPRTVEHHVASLLARTGTARAPSWPAFARANRVAAARLTG